MSMPVAVVGMDFREGPSSVRAMLKSLDDGPESPSARLRASSECEGIARIESCSRIEWVISAKNATWAAELLRGGLLKGLGEVGAGRRMHVKHSTGALLYLLRVSLGLESVAEGEHAIGRQVLRGFETAHSSGSTDRTLHLCWHAVGRLLQARKETGVASSVGVQSLVVTELDAVSRSAAVAILGRGEMGRQIEASLHRHGFAEARAFSRADWSAFDRLATTAPVVIVATGGPQTWLELPARSDAPLLIDVGAPLQVVSFEGWRLIGLDELLTRRGLLLDEASLSTLDTLANEGAESLREALDAASAGQLLQALDHEKRKFLEDDIEGVLSGLPKHEAQRVAEALRGFTHRVLEVTRRSTRVS